MIRDDRDRPRVGVGVGVFVTRGDEILLMRRANSHGAGSWSSPGGHLDFGEDPVSCASRETLEETGVQIANIRFMGVTNDLFDSEGKHYITVWMHAEYASGLARVNAEDEMTEVAWFPMHSLPEPLFLPLQNLIEGKCYRSSAESNVGSYFREIS